jgi:hypothetical protein
MASPQRLRTSARGGSGKATEVLPAGNQNEHRAQLERYPHEPATKVAPAMTSVLLCHNVGPAVTPYKRRLLFTP